jgi:hypothetical protein
MSSTLSGTLGAGFARLFGGANSLLASFAGAFIETMTRLAMNKLFSLVFGMGVGVATGGVGTAVGAATGLGAAGGSGIPSDILSVGGSSSGGAMAKMDQLISTVASLNLRVDNQGLYFATQRGRMEYVANG